MAMGQNPAPPVNIPIPTKIGSKMGGEFTYPNNGIPLVLTHGQMAMDQVATLESCKISLKAWQDEFIHLPSHRSPLGFRGGPQTCLLERGRLCTSMLVGG